MADDFWQYERLHKKSVALEHAANLTATEVLLRSPAHVVAEFLKARSQGRLNDDEKRVSPDEKRLLASDDTLIRLALARWGEDSTVLEELLASYGSGTPERLAVLQNETGFLNLEATLFPDGAEYDVQRQLDVLRNAAPGEVAAFAANRSARTSTLQKLLADCCEDHTETNKQVLLELISGLPAREDLTDQQFDGHAEFEIRELKKTIWLLALKLPSEVPYPHFLRQVYDVLLSSKVVYLDRTDGMLSAEDARTAIHKWLSFYEQDSRDLFHGVYLDLVEELVMHIARAAIAAKHILPKECFESENRALRCAAYSECEMTEEDAERLGKSGSVSEVESALRNRKNWRTSEARSRLEAAFDRVERRAKHYDLESADFEKAENIIRACFPEYFEPTPTDTMEDDMDFPVAEDPEPSGMDVVRDTYVRLLSLESAVAVLRMRQMAGMVALGAVLYLLLV